MKKNKSVGRAEISLKVHHTIGIPLSESTELVEDILWHISDALVCGETVKLSSFGTFGTHQKAARIGRNPKTGVEAEISPRRIVTFRPSNKMKLRVNNGKRERTD
ncbi:MAG: HU family DNA-binding protein [Aestuariivita sp.]|nr:HU family DNA-binding protein [Aestuariivita sp.]MCY4203281.1 HU family DNA-binding protein [Aestuariivita sp.]MCY4287192.1 HU family DNA-binding protein [Aestuariivita sp.]MCY4347500.1 HU family DNA-binding protein [Aestuariivita sp.]